MMVAGFTCSLWIFDYWWLLVGWFAFAGIDAYVFIILLFCVFYFITWLLVGFGWVLIFRCLGLSVFLVLDVSVDSSGWYWGVEFRCFSVSRSDLRG